MTHYVTEIPTAHAGNNHVPAMSENKYLRATAIIAGVTFENWEKQHDLFNCLRGTGSHCPFYGHCTKPNVHFRDEADPIEMSETGAQSSHSF